MMDDSFCTQTAESYFASSVDIVHVFPTEIMFLVFAWLDLESLCLCRSVSRTWRKHVNGYLGSLFCLDFVPHQSVLTEDGLRQMLKSVSNLRVLHVDNCWLSVTEENLFLIAQNCSKLSVLTASRCKGVTDVGLEAIARQCKELAEVDLSSCFTISDVGIMALSEQCSHLKELHVSSCYGVTDKSITVLAQQCLGLTELDVSYCYYVTDQSIKLFLSPKCKLKLLRIKGCSKVSQGLVSQLMSNGVVVNNFF